MNGNAALKNEVPETVVAVLPKPKEGEITPKEAELVSEVTDIELRAEAVVIKSDQDFEVAGEFGVLLKQKAGEVTDFFKPLKDAAYKAHKAVCDREKEMLTPLKNAEKVLKKTMGDYTLEKERQRRELEEAMRLAAEEESRRKLEEAARLEKEGRGDDAEAALADAEIMEGAGRMSSIPSTVPKAKGVSTRKDWEIVSVDDKAVPLSINGAMLRPVDQAAVMRLIWATKGTISIPGIMYKEVAKMSFSRSG